MKRLDPVTVITSDGEVRDAVFLHQDKWLNTTFVRLMPDRIRTTCWVPSERVLARAND